jgi:hypothetical protein
MTGGGVSANTERRAFLFNPTTNTFTAGADLHTGRFYPTTLTLADGTALTLFGEDHANAPGTGVQSLEIFTPGGAGSWGPAKTVPFNYFLLSLDVPPPQRQSLYRRAAKARAPVRPNGEPNPRQSGPPIQPNLLATRSEHGRLPLRPPHYEPRVMVVGGSAPDARQTAEWIDLSVAAPAWQALPNF